MRSTSSSLALSLTLAMAACGGGASAPSAPSAAISEATSLAIAQQVVDTALGGLAEGGVVTGAAVRGSASAPLESLSCATECSGAGCTVTCPINESFRCRFGGSVRGVGQISGTLDQTRSGEAALATFQSYSACQPTTSLTIEGARSTSVTGNMRFSWGQLEYVQAVRITGHVRFLAAGEPSECDVDVNVEFDRLLHGGGTGTACGHPVCVNF